jgi:hypothetical protein
MLNVSQIADVSALAATADYDFVSNSHKVVSVQAVWTATTASFELKLQMSNDNATWADFTTATAISNANGDVMWHVDSKDAMYWRVLATRTSGTLTTLAVYVANSPR